MANRHRIGRNNMGIIEQGTRQAFTPGQQKLNSDSRSQSLPKPNDAKKTRYGTIINAIQQETTDNLGRIVVEIRFDDKINTITQGTYKRFFILSETIDYLALVYGDLEDIIGLRVAVEQHSASEDNGLAYISNPTGAGHIDRFTAIAPIGTILAPAD